MSNNQRDLFFISYIHFGDLIFGDEDMHMSQNREANLHGFWLTDANECVIIGLVMTSPLINSKLLPEPKVNCSQLEIAA